MLPLALLLTRLIVPVHVVYCSLDLMLLTIVRQSEGFKVGSISCRTTISWRSRSGWESGEFAGVLDGVGRLRWFRFFLMTGWNSPVAACAYEGLDGPALEGMFASGVRGLSRYIFGPSRALRWGIGLVAAAVGVAGGAFWGVVVVVGAVGAVGGFGGEVPWVVVRLRMITTSGTGFWGSGIAGLVEGRGMFWLLMVFCSLSKATRFLFRVSMISSIACESRLTLALVL